MIYEGSFQNEGHVHWSFYAWPFCRAVFPPCNDPSSRCSRVEHRRTNRRTNMDAVHLTCDRVITARAPRQWRRSIHCTRDAIAQVSQSPRPARPQHYLLGRDDATMATTASSLSVLTRTPTPPSNGSSYLTASEGTLGSSSGTEPSSPADDSRHSSCNTEAVYRDAVALPRELKLRCQIHLEEQYCEHCP
jgi:hypothetical protein